MNIIFLQVVLYCSLFTLLVALSFRGNAINIVYFYPKSVIDKVVEFGYTDYKTVKRNKIIFYFFIYCSYVWKFDINCWIME